MPAVIICPGGSYFWLDTEGEGAEVAQWLNSEGIAAFVLNYHVAGKFTFGTDFRFLWGGCTFPAVLNDTQTALLQVREHADETGIDPENIGLMGFSAGGHLAMLTEGVGGEEPDFVACMYPVVTLSDKRCVHKRSRPGLLGAKQTNRILRDSLSLEKHVPESCCPVFLVGCLDDNTVNPLNFTLLDSSLTAGHIRHESHIFPCGGHGFGCSAITDTNAVYDWKPLFVRWLSSLKGASQPVRQ
ncbi:MAG: alpha/beta hydrolase [Bacteroidales bacterium]|nr:alpha/beta hydrolase [Bacteroidales bacterium]